VAQTVGKSLKSGILIRCVNRHQIRLKMRIMALKAPLICRFHLFCKASTTSSKGIIASFSATKTFKARICLARPWHSGLPARRAGCRLSPLAAGPNICRKPSWQLLTVCAQANPRRHSTIALAVASHGTSTGPNPLASSHQYYHQNPNAQIRQPWHYPHYKRTKPFIAASGVCGFL